MEITELEKIFDTNLADKTGGSNIHDFELRRTVAALGKAVLKLDRSSERLATVNIVLAVVLVVIGFVQICLMVRGR